MSVLRRGCVCTDVGWVSVPRAEFSEWLLDSMRCAVIAVDQGSAIAAFNEDARRILGFASERVEESFGRPAHEVLGSQPGLARLLDEALSGSEHPARSELRLAPSAQGGRSPTIGYTLGAVHDTSGALRGAAIYFRDLTPIERVDEQERLHTRLEALGEMAAGLAHEIRNPLAAMEVCAGLLERRSADRKDELELARSIVGEIHRIERVVERAVDFVRPAAPEEDRLDLAQVVEASLARALARFPFDGVVECDFSEERVPVAGDSLLLESAIGNLLVNALEAMSEVPAAEARLRVSIAMEKTGELEEIVLSIGDTGPGISPELRERVFYPFFTTKQTGLGIGLANAQKIVSGHGGFLSLEAEPAGGTLFRIHLPVPGGSLR